MTIKDQLIAAKARIEKGWTQGWFAKDAEGHNIDYEHPKATCWCMMGAAKFGI